jgi:hypothetical protein
MAQCAPIIEINPIAIKCRDYVVLGIKMDSQHNGSASDGYATAVKPSSGIADLAPLMGVWNQLIDRGRLQMNRGSRPSGWMMKKANMMDS